MFLEDMKNMVNKMLNRILDHQATMLGLCSEFVLQRSDCRTVEPFLLSRIYPSLLIERWIGPMETTRHY